MKAELTLHETILPKLMAWCKENKENKTVDPDDIKEAEAEVRDLLDATVFDCRLVPMDLLEKFSDDVWKNVEGSDRKIELPYNKCYFEFSDDACFLAQYLEQSDIEGTVVRGVIICPFHPNNLIDDVGIFPRPSLLFSNNTEEGFLGEYGSSDSETWELCVKDAHLFLCLFALLEKGLIQIQPQIDTKNIPKIHVLHLDEKTSDLRKEELFQEKSSDATLSELVQALPTNVINKNKLAIHAIILPSLSKWVKENWSTGMTSHDIPQMVQAMAISSDFASLKKATIFDCRSLPIEFIEDTGNAYWEEAEQTNEQIRLPSPDCYFEFADSPHILAQEVLDGSESDPEGKFTPVEIRTYSDNSVMGRGRQHGEFPNGVPFSSEKENAKTFFCWTRGDNGDVSNATEIFLAAKRLLGVLSLLKEQLIIDRFEPDPDPRGSAKRAKRNQLPYTSDTHILKINVPAVRRAAIKLSEVLGSHASPALHWRRGHWRTLHRGSEFETRTWVRKCLVGDPDKGFVRSSYQITKQSFLLH